MLPALPTEIDRKSALWHVNNVRYAMSQKVDGRRVLTHIRNRQVWAYGRNGETPIPAKLEKTLASIKGEWQFDGELVAGTYWIFDLLMLNGKDVRGWPWIQRQEYLIKLLNRAVVPNVKVLPHIPATHTGDKLKAFIEYEEHSIEGAVFKEITKPYVPGRTRAQLKFKFTKTVDCVVDNEGYMDRANLVLAVYMTADTMIGKEFYRAGDLFPCGRVSALTGEGHLVKVGDVVTVKCLYTSEDYQLVQPTYPKIRRDKKPKQCTFDQLEILQTNKEVLV